MSGKARRVAGLLLAAGRSARMVGANKLLLAYEGEPLVRRAAAALCRAGLNPVLVVTGHEAEAVEAALEGLAVTFRRNPDFAQGLATSLARGIAALPAGIEGVAIALADMPRLSEGHLARLLAAFEPERGGAICVPVFRGRRGHPVLFAARFFAEIERLRGDEGARPVIARNARVVREVEVGDDGVLVDIDTEADYLHSARPS